MDKSFVGLIEARMVISAAFLFKLVVHLLPCGLRDPVTSNLLSCRFTSYVKIQHHGVIYKNYEQKKIDAFKQYTNLFEVLIQ